MSVDAVNSVATAVSFHDDYSCPFFRREDLLYLAEIFFHHQLSQNVNFLSNSNSKYQ